jgi:putative transposase
MNRGELVLKLARESSWGYTRNFGELRKPWIKTVSLQTEEMIQKEQDINPAPKRGKGS